MTQISTGEHSLALSSYAEALREVDDAQNGGQLVVYGHRLPYPELLLFPNETSRVWPAAWSPDDKARYISSSIFVRSTALRAVDTTAIVDEAMLARVAQDKNVRDGLDLAVRKVIDGLPLHLCVVPEGLEHAALGTPWRVLTAAKESGKLCRSSDAWYGDIQMAHLGTWQASAVRETAEDLLGCRSLITGHSALDMVATAVASVETPSI